MLNNKRRAKDKLKGTQRKTKGKLKEAKGKLKGSVREAITGPDFCYSGVTHGAPTCLH